MPNWCQNEVSIYGDNEHIKKLKAEVFTVDEDNDQPYLDFNKVIPMPKELASSTSPRSIVSEEVIRMRDLVKANPSIQSIWVDGKQIKNDGWSDKYITERQSEILKKTYGANNWYDWRVTNWGTKWGIDGESIQFYDEDDDHVSKTIGETAVDDLWSVQSNLDKFHDIRNRIAELVTLIEWERLE